MSASPESPRHVGRALEERLCETRTRQSGEQQHRLRRVREEVRVDPVSAECPCLLELGKASRVTCREEEERVVVGQLGPQGAIKRLRLGDPLEKGEGFVRTLESEPLAATVRKARVVIPPTAGGGVVEHKEDVVAFPPDAAHDDRLNASGQHFKRRPDRAQPLEPEVQVSVADGVDLA